MVVGHVRSNVSERESEIERDTDVGLDDSTTGMDDFGLDSDLGTGGVGSAEQTGGRSEQTTSESGWLRSRIGSSISTIGLVVAMVLSIFGVILAGAIPLIGQLGDLLGIFLATFLFGVATSSPKYLESSLAGGAVGLGSVFASNLVFGILGIGLFPVLLGLFGGAAAGALGQYYGQDLRDGLTRDLGDPPT